MAITKNKRKKKREFNLHSFTIAVLRRASYRSPARSEALRLARPARNTYKCAACQKSFGRKEVQVDHIECVVPVTGWDNWDGFITRLFTGRLQVLCRPCHSVKSKVENAERRLHAAKGKKTVSKPKP